MPLVKLIVTDYNSYGDSYHSSDMTRLVADLTDWEEIPLEDLNFIQKNKWQLWNTIRYEAPFKDSSNLQLNICVLDDVPLKERIADLKVKLADQLKREAEASEKRKIQTESRKRQKALQKAAQEKKTYEALKAKFDATVPTSSGS